MTLPPHLPRLARAGDVRAFKELFDRTPGKPQETDLVERIERLEEYLAEQAARA